MMNFDALLVYLRDQIDEKVEVRWGDPELKRYLNVEYRTLCNAIKQKRGNYYEKEGVINTVANVKTVDLPVDFSGTLISLMYGNTVLIPGDRREFVYSKSDSREQPRNFDFLGGSKLWLHPVPDKVYPLDIAYEYLPSDMVAGTDVPYLPDGYEILIVDGAIISCKLKDYQSIEEMLIRYRALRNQMLKSIRPKQTFKSSRVRSI